MPKLRTVVAQSTDTKQRHEVVRQQATVLSDRLENDYLELAAVLNEVFHNGYASAQYGFKSFDHWVESELKVGRRKARYLVEIWDIFKDNSDKLSREDLLSMGWTKAKELKNVLENDDAQEYIDFALDKNNTFEDLVDKIKESTDDITTGRRSRTVGLVKVRFVDSDYRVWFDAVDLSKRLLETSDESAALAHICGEWLEHQDHGRPEKTSIKDIISWVERSYDVKLSIIGGEIPQEQIEDVKEKVIEIPKKKVIKPVVEDDDLIMDLLRI